LTGNVRFEGIRFDAVARTSLNVFDHVSWPRLMHTSGEKRSGITNSVISVAARLMCKSLEGLDIFSADDVDNWNYLESIKVCHMTRTYW
jgi:hypothetical protein